MFSGRELWPIAHAPGAKAKTCAPGSAGI